MNMDDDTQPIECRAAVEISATSRNEVLFLPIGLHSITPVAGGIGRPIKVKVDASTAEAIEAQRKIMAGKGKRPYFDFDHEDGAASFWPEGFAWRNGEGVIAKGEWTARGRKAVEGKDYRAFSPVFHVDNKRSDPAKVICMEHAAPNMGGLVNNPAFNLPLWAKNAGVTAQSTTNPEAARLLGTNKEETEMQTEELAALRAKQMELERNEQDESNENKLAAVRSEIKAGELEIEASELRAANDALVAKQRKRQLEDAQAEVRQAVKRGAIKARDIDSQRMWESEIAANPKKKDLLRSIPDNPAIHGGAITTSANTWASNARVTITNDDPVQAFGELARVTSLSCRASQPDQRRKLSLEFASIYAREFKGSNKERMLSFPVAEFESAIMGADVTDTNLKTLSGSLVTQRTLELLKFTFPSLTMFTTDFSDQAAQFNQTVITRTVTIPNVTDYNTTTGWADSTAANVDVPVTINKHKGVNITFNEQILASTVRRLFDEFAPAAAYALSKQMVDDLYANITDANFTNNSVTATSAFARTSVIDIGTQLTLRGVPLALGQRTLLLYPTVFSKLVADTALITFAAYQKPELITAPQNGASLVIPVDTFQVVNAPNLPTNNGNVTGFGCSKSALIIATRLPNDYTSANPGANYGSVQVMTEPDIGISVMLTQYVNHQLAAATSRISLMYGTAAGQTAAGQLLKAAAGSGSSRT
jgi:anti-sigma28 factor (negative regulator of flagellin synthesis)